MTKLGPERLKLKKRLEELEAEVQPYPELDHVLKQIRSALEDLIEPLGLSFARAVVREAEEQIEEKAPDTQRDN